MKINIYNNINGFFIITPHFNDDGKIKCVYNKFDNNKKLEYSIDEENYHIEQLTDCTDYNLYTYNNNIVITGEIHKPNKIEEGLQKFDNNSDDYCIYIYYCYDPSIHININSFPGNYKKMQLCIKDLTDKNIKHLITNIYDFIKTRMYTPNTFSGHDLELKKIIIDMFIKIGLINYYELYNINQEDKYFEKFNKNN